MALHISGKRGEGEGTSAASPGPFPSSTIPTKKERGPTLISKMRETRAKHQLARATRVEGAFHSLWERGNLFSILKNKKEKGEGEREERRGLLYSSSGRKKSGNKGRISIQRKGKESSAPSKKSRKEGGGGLRLIPIHLPHPFLLIFARDGERNYRSTQSRKKGGGRA